MWWFSPFRIQICTPVLRYLNLNLHFCYFRLKAIRHSTTHHALRFTKRRSRDMIHPNIAQGILFGSTGSGPEMPVSGPNIKGSSGFKCTKFQISELAKTSTCKFNVVMLWVVMLKSLSTYQFLHRTWLNIHYPSQYNGNFKFQSGLLIQTQLEHTGASHARPASDGMVFWLLKGSYNMWCVLGNNICFWERSTVQSILITSIHQPSRRLRSYKTSCWFPQA